MKKLLNILTSFSIISICGFNLIACDIKNDDNTNDNTVQVEKSNLEKAKDFLTNGVTITNVLPDKTIKEYIEHIKKMNKNEINNEINFILDDTYETKYLDQLENDIIVLLEDDGINELVQFKLKLLDTDSIIDNILSQAKEKIKEIKGIGLLATNTISEDEKDRIVKLIEDKIDNNDIKVDWSDQSTLTSLVTEEENKGKVELSVVKDDGTSKSEIVDFSIIEVLDSRKAVNQQLIETVALEIQEIDVEQEAIEENVNLSDVNFKNTIEELIKKIIADSRITVILNEEDTTLKQKENKISVKLSTGIDDDSFEKDITISLLNMLSDEKKKNEAILNKLKHELNSVDGINLNASLLITDKRIWDAINQKIELITGTDDYLKIHVSAPPSLPNSSTIVQQVFNNAKGLGRRNINQPNQNRPNQNRPNQNRPNQNRPNQNRPNQNRPNQNQPNQNRPNQNQPNQNRPNQNRPNQNRPNQNQNSESNSSIIESATNFADRWSKTATLESTQCIVTAFIKVGSGKDKVQDLILVQFTNIIS